MNIQKRTNIIIGLLVLLIISSILTINYLKERADPEEDILKCVAENSVLVVSKTCSHCANQKIILGDSIKEFEIIDVSEHPEVWDEYNLIGVPAWIINDEIYYGVKEIEQLHDLVNCQNV